MDTSMPPSSRDLTPSLDAPQHDMSYIDRDQARLIHKRLDEIEKEYAEVKTVIPQMTEDMVEMLQTDSLIIADRIAAMRLSLRDISTRDDWELIKHKEYNEGPAAALVTVKGMYEKAGREARTIEVLITMLTTSMQILQDKIKYLYVDRQ